MPQIDIPPLSGQPVLPSWFSSEPGRALIAGEKNALVTLVPDNFYRVGLQYGLNEYALMQDLNVELGVYADSGRAEDTESVNNVLTLPEALPLADSSVDIALLLHTLDYCENPHEVLRQVSQVLRPEGVLVLSGFHPYSLWGAERYMHRRQAPFDARFISRTVVQDWLELLGFQPLTGCVLNYQLPKLNQRWRERLEWMNKMGDRWWPTLGAVYMLVVRKKVYSGIGVKSPARPGKKWFPELNPAQAKVTNKTS